MDFLIIGTAMRHAVYRLDPSPCVAFTDLSDAVGGRRIGALPSDAVDREDLPLGGLVALAADSEGVIALEFFNG